MSPTLAPAQRAVPRFYVTPPQRLGLRALLPALLLASGCVFAVQHALHHARRGNPSADSPSFGNGGSDTGDGQDNDDPSQVDTIYLGGPDQAPVATRPSGRPSTVHPFVTVRLPRSGRDFGQIPDTPAGHLLFSWLAAFNSEQLSDVAAALPASGHPGAQAAQVALRQQTGGFTLISAREIEPGLLVFRLHDQTPAFTEALGTLQVRPGSVPAAIASFSLRSLPPAPGAQPAPSVPPAAQPATAR